MLAPKLNGPVPAEPFSHIMRMSWLDLCFMHWAVDPQLLRPTLPKGLELDTRDGQAWLGVVPFRMENVAPRFVPNIPSISAFPELNLRTYVKLGGVSGVWFYSLDAAQPLAVRVARALFHLPYFDAKMWIDQANIDQANIDQANIDQENIDQESVVNRYASQRIHKGAPAGEFIGAYRPTSSVFEAKAGSLEDWLTNRLYLFSADKKGKIYRGKVAHAPWPLQWAEAEIKVNTLADPLGMQLVGQPHLLYARRLDVVAWWPQKIN